MSTRGCPPFWRAFALVARAEGLLIRRLTRLTGVSVRSLLPLPKRMPRGFSFHSLSAQLRPSAVVPDWSRERCTEWWQPSRRLLRAIRDYTTARLRGGFVGFVYAKLAAVRHRFWSIVCGADIPLNTRGIAGGLILPHPNGVVIHPEAVYRYAY